MDYKKMWEDLKEDMKNALRDGMYYEFNTPTAEEDTPVDAGRFQGYRYVMDFIEEQEGKYEEN